MTPVCGTRTLILSAAMLAAIVIAVLCAGCTTPNQSPATTQDPAAFIAAANDCRAMNLTVTNTVGTFTYQSSSDCALLKTLVKMNASEPTEVREYGGRKEHGLRLYQGEF